MCAEPVVVPVSASIVRGANGGTSGAVVLWTVGFAAWPCVGARRAGDADGARVAEPPVDIGAGDCRYARARDEARVAVRRVRSATRPARRPVAAQAAS